MGAKTLTISVTEEDLKYLNEDDLLSPSKIFRTALYNLKKNREQDVNTIIRLENKCKVMQDKIFDLQDQIEHHGNKKSD